MKQKSPQVVKHVVKGEKWACSTINAGKNKPVLFVAKTRDFKRFYEINKEKSGILRLPIFGLTSIPCLVIFLPKSGGVAKSREKTDEISGTVDCTDE